MTSLRSISLLLWTLSAIYSVSGTPRLPGTSPPLVLALNSRQSNLPNAPGCETTCDPVGAVIQNCVTPDDGCCTPLFQSSFFNCLKCVGLATNATKADWAVAQADLDNLTIACSEAGFALPELTLPTQNPNRTLATASPGQSSHSSFSQMTISDLQSILAPSITNSQKTVTALSSQPTVTQPSAPSSIGPPSPTSSTSAALPHAGRFNAGVALLGVVVSAWIMNIF